MLEGQLKRSQTNARRSSHPFKTLPCGRPLPKKSSAHPRSFETTWKEKLETYLTAHELNQTDSRNKLIELVLQIPGHFTIQELIKRVSDVHPQIGTATIYRNIPVLVGAGLLKETLTDDVGQQYYELAGDEHDDHHDHIVCMDCNQIFEFHDKGIEKAQDRVSAELDFQPVKHRHVIFAACGYRK